MELKVDKLAILVGVSARTINNWYWFKATYPDNEYAKMLPDYKVGKTERNIPVRLWDSDDIDKLIHFKEVVPHGRNGILGDITQRRYRKQREEKLNGKKETDSNA